MNKQLLEPPPGVLFQFCSWTKRIWLLPRTLQIKRCQWQWIAKDQRQKADFVYLGEGENLPYFLTLLPASVSSQDSDSAHFTRLNAQIPSELANGRIVFIEHNRMLAPLFPAGGLVSYPWVRQEIDLASERYHSLRPAIEANYGRRVRKHHFMMEISKSAAEVDLFYDEFYVPHSQKRFGAQTHLRSRHELRRAVQAGFLLKVMYQGQWVAGDVCRIHEKRLMALAIGLRKRSETLWHMGAMSSVYYFILQWAEQHQMQRIDLFRTRPHIRDGVYNHKSRWGALPRVDPWVHQQIRIYLPADHSIPGPLEGLLIERAPGLIPLQSLKIK